MKKLFTILLLLVAFISVKAADILVNSSGLAGSYTTISAAVQAASAGDRILISPQIMPYQKDTLVIDKDLTLMPYATNSFVGFEGSIQLTLDSIANFTLIGFRGTFQFNNLFSVFNDTSRNSLSVINIIDCMIGNIRMDQPKTSLYLSYSKVEMLAFSHGDIIGNKIDNMYFGNFDYSSAASQPAIDCYTTTGQSPEWFAECMLEAPKKYWSDGNQLENNLNATNNGYLSTECDLFADYIPFGNVDVYSDTCNIIANYFDGSGYAPFSFFNLDFPVNFSNNYLSSSGSGGTHYYLLASSAKGTNQFVNNIYKDIYEFWNLAYCPANSLFNFSDILVHRLNNIFGGIQFYAPNAGGNTADYSALPIVKNSVRSYNQNGNNCGEYASGSSGVCDAFFLEIGPAGQPPSNSNPNGVCNPSLKYLNLDLTPNTPGVDGGSNSWFNYHGVTCSYDDNTGWYGVNGTTSTTAESLLQELVNYQVHGTTNNWSESELTFNNAGNMPPGSKARITYLNLPTQIFDPANIRVKAKAVHGN